MHSLSWKSSFSLLHAKILMVIFKLKLVFGVMSYRSKCDFKMFQVVDLTNLGGQFFSLDLYLIKKRSKVRYIKCPSFSVFIKLGKNHSNLNSFFKIMYSKVELIPEDAEKMSRDQISTQKVFLGLGPGAFLQKHRDKISYINRSITQTSHIQINLSDLFGLSGGPNMGFYHDAFAGMPRDQVQGNIFVWFFGPEAFLRGLPVLN